MKENFLLSPGFFVFGEGEGKIHCRSVTKIKLHTSFKFKSIHLHVRKVSSLEIKSPWFNSVLNHKLFLGESTLKPGLTSISTDTVTVKISSNF